MAIVAGGRKLCSTMGRIGGLIIIGYMTSCTSIGGVDIAALMAGKTILRDGSMRTGKRVHRIVIE
jgi:hypothetical protein